MADRVPRHVPRAVATQHLRVDTADDSDSATSAHPSRYYLAAVAVSAR